MASYKMNEKDQRELFAELKQSFEISCSTIRRKKASNPPRKLRTWMFNGVKAQAATKSEARAAFKRFGAVSPFQVSEVA